MHPGTVSRTSSLLIYFMVEGISRILTHCQSIDHLNSRQAHRDSNEQISTHRRVLWYWYAMEKDVRQGVSRTGTWCRLWRLNFANLSPHITICTTFVYSKRLNYSTTFFFAGEYYKYSFHARMLPGRLPFYTALNGTVCKVRLWSRWYR